MGMTFIEAVASLAFRTPRVATLHEAEIARIMQRDAAEAGHFGATPVAFIPNADADKRNPLQALILAHAATQDGPITQTETAEAIGWRRTSMSAAFSRLVQLGQLRRTSNGWHITAKGRGAVEK